MKNLERNKEFERKISEYRHFLKNDFDSDYTDILRLLQYKLARTRKCIVNNNIVVSAQKIGNQIKKVEKLLGQVLADRYYEIIAREFHKKFGRSRIVKLPYKKGNRGISITIRYPKETPQNARIIHREAMRLHKRAEQMKSRDLKKAFDFIYKNIWGWWD